MSKWPQVTTTKMPSSLSLLASWLAPIVGIGVGMPIGIGAATIGNTVLVYGSMAFMLCFALLYPAYIGWRAFRARGWLGLFSTGVWVVIAYIVFVLIL